MRTPRRPFRGARAILVVAILLVAWSVSELVANDADQPVVSSFSPLSGPIGTVVTIHGSEFTGATRVTLWGGVPSAYTVHTDDQITTVVPSGAAIGRIKVTTPSGTATSPVAFQVIPAPSITSVSPSSGVAGTVVTVFGANLEGS